jgi:hypothetical protein
MIADAIYADTVLRDKAVVAVSDFARQHDLPVKRSQISGLRQIAGNEPGLLKDFLDHQRDRAQKRFQSSGQRNETFESEIKFWEMVGLLCLGRPPRCEWSLELDAEYHITPDMRNEKLPPGAQVSAEQRAIRQRRDEHRKSFLESWRRRVYPIFFQHFCAEYLFRLTTQAKGGPSDDSDD